MDRFCIGDFIDDDPATMSVGPANRTYFVTEKLERLRARMPEIN